MAAKLMQSVTYSIYGQALISLPVQVSHYAEQYGDTYEYRCYMQLTHLQLTVSGEQNYYRI